MDDLPRWRQVDSPCFADDSLCDGKQQVRLRLSLLGAVISLGLTVVGLLSLKAVCAWCLLSLAIITTLFVLVHLKKPDAAPGTAWRKWWLGNGVLALLVLGAMAAYHHNDLLQRPEDPQAMALAIHLQETGA